MWVLIEIPKELENNFKADRLETTLDNAISDVTLRKTIKDIFRKAFCTLTVRNYPFGKHLKLDTVADYDEIMKRMEKAYNDGFMRCYHFLKKGE